MRSRGAGPARRRLAARASVTVVLVGKEPTCAGDRAAHVGQRAQVGLLGLVAVPAQQRRRHLLLQLGLQLAALHPLVRDQL